MKNLSEIQLEIRELEKQASDILNRLSALEKDIGEIREAKTEKNKAENFGFKDLPKLAGRFKFGTHPIYDYSDYNARLYIKTLMQIVSVSKEGVLDRAVFVQWILGQSKLKTNFEELLREETDERFYNDLKREFQTFRKMYLMTDVFITIGLGSPKDENDDAYKIASDLAALFNLSSEEISIYIDVAKAVLRQNVSDCSYIAAQNLRGRYSYYMPVFNENPDVGYAAKKTINNNQPKPGGYRELIGKYQSIDIKFTVSTGTWVTADQIIARIYKPDKFNSSSNWLKSKRTGYLYFILHNGFFYVIISMIQSENREDLKQWLRQKGEIK